MADGKSVWVWKEIVESSEEVLCICRSYVRVGRNVREWFPVEDGLCQGYVMSPRLFNVHIDVVVREVNARVIGKGLELLCTTGGRYEISQVYLHR